MRPIERLLQRVQFALFAVLALCGLVLVLVLEVL